MACRSIGQFAKSALKMAPKRIASRSYNYQGRDPMSDVMRDFQRNIQELERTVDRAFNQLSGGRAGLPQLLKPSEVLGFGNQDTRDVPVEHHEFSDNQKVHKVEMDMRGFEPEDVNISVRDKIVSIKATKSVTNSDGSKSRRNFEYEFTLPQNAKTDQVRSFFRPDSTLSIETPLVQNQDDEPIKPRLKEIKVVKAGEGQNQEQDGDSEQRPLVDQTLPPFDLDKPIEQRVPTPGDDDFPKDVPNSEGVRDRV
ncbi:hypothetical protein HDE_12708 [Halotydeus destructor]|nr:hypothetical protein HDE_12708 [Halotydeus destructor]